MTSSSVGASWSELSDGGGEHAAEPSGGGMDAVVLERVNRFAHAAVIGAEGYGAHKRWRCEAAGTAEMG